MSKRVLSLLLLLLLLSPSSMPYSAAQEAQIDGSKDFHFSRVMFIENAGQWPDPARFQVWGGTSGTMWLAEDAIWLTVVEQSSVADSHADRLRARDPAIFNLQPADLSPARAVNIKLFFVGANPHPRVEPFDRLDTKVSYFIGNDPDRWRPDVPVWGGVRYMDLYPGVDLEVMSEGGQMVQRLSARPDADLSRVRLRVEGAEAASVEGAVLRLSTAAGDAIVPLLRTDRMVVGGAQPQPLGVQAFHIAAPYIATRLSQQWKTIKPYDIADSSTDLLFSAFLGGNRYDRGDAMTVDATGNAYVTGQTASVDFPSSAGAFDTNINGGYDVLVAKVDSTGTGLTYATFLGGVNEDWGRSIAIDQTGSTYVTGETASPDFPSTQGAFDTSFNGMIDAFVVKLNSSGGGLSYATLLGGSREDQGKSVVVDVTGGAYVTGITDSSNFPLISGAYDMSYNGSWDTFVVKLNPGGSQLAYATLLGGDDSDTGSGISVDGTGAAYVTGTTKSTNFPTTSGAFDTSFNGWDDVFVIKLNAAGTGLSYATFIGGFNQDWGAAVDVDQTGAACVTGWTSCGTFPTTPRAFDTTCNGSWDAFVARLHPTGNQLLYSTLLGGSDGDGSWAIDLDETGNAYITGETGSTDFPVTGGAFDMSHNGSEDAFLAKVNPEGSQVLYATYFGGTQYDKGTGISLDENRNAYATGYAGSGDLPTTPGAFDTTSNGLPDAFVAKFAMGAAPAYTISGRVTDAGGLTGIGGVTVWVDVTHSTTTDANGDYTLTGLPAGTHNIRPSKPGYSFFPSSGTITVPPDATAQDFVGAPSLTGTLTLSPLYPPSDQPSEIMRGGIGHRYYEVRDSTGHLAPLVTVTFSSTARGTSDVNGLLDVEFAANDHNIPGRYTFTASSASRWGENFALAEPASFVLEVQERPFQHHWYGGTVHKAKGGISAGLVAFLEGRIKGGLGWELEETDVGSTHDDTLRLTEQFQGEVGGGAGIGAKTPDSGVVITAQAGAELTTEIKALGLGEWQARFDEPYNASAQKAQAVYVLSGLLDIVPEMPDAPALAATLLILTADVDYAAYREREAFGAGVEWTPLHLYEGVEFKFAGVSPVMQWNALDAEATLRLFGTYSEDTARDEWSLALEQEVGFDLDLLTVQTLVTQKVGAYVGDHSTKLKEELFFDRTTGDPVRFELSLTGEGNATTITDIPLRAVTTKFIVEGEDLDLALERVRNLTALLAAWKAAPSRGLIVGSSAALQEVQSYLTSIPLSRYEVTAATDESREIVPEIGWTGILDIELGAGAEFKHGREIVVERGYATALDLVPFVNGLLPTEVYPDHQYGQEAGKTIWDLLDNALAGAYLLVQDLFDQIVKSVQQGTAWLLDVVARTADGLVVGGAQLISDEGTMLGATGTGDALLAPAEELTITASAWAPATTSAVAAASSASLARLQSASGEEFAIGGVYQFSPYTTTLTPPATLVITYTANALGTADPNLLGLYRWQPEEANWQPLSAEHAISARAMTTTVDQLGTYTIGYDTAPPIITMIQPSYVVMQTHLPSVSAVITDTGSGVAPASVELRLDGQLVDATYAPLSGQLWYTDTAFLANGTYPYTLTAADTAGNQATYEGSFTVNVPAPTVLGIDPPAVPQGIAATVTIAGTDFGYPPTVQVDGVTMTDVEYQGLMAISVTLPSDLSLGSHSVTVMAPDGQSGSLAEAFTVVDPAALKPLAPTLAIEQSPESVTLAWQHRTLTASGYPASVTHYEIWRGASPYFNPGDTGALIAQVIPPPWASEGELISYREDLIDRPTRRWFYRVRSVSVYGFASDLSDPVRLSGVDLFLPLVTR